MRYLIIAPIQYGYNTDFYKYSEILSLNHEVHYLGVDMNKPKRESSKVKVIEVKKDKTGGIYALLKRTRQLSQQYSYDKILVYTFPFCFLLSFIFTRKNLIMDIRTSYITSKIKTWILNKDILFESLFFPKVSVISYGVADYLGIKKSKRRLLPLGSDAGVLSKKNDINGIKMLYVGTFYRRNIEVTVDGVNNFLKRNPQISPSEFQYTIIGIGSVEDRDKIASRIETYNIKDFVKFIGEVRFEALIPYYQTHNVGVSYIPLTKFYDCQPPTKTFEYLLNSMIVLGTATSENKKVIAVNNGILTDDTAVGFSNGIEELNKRIHENKYELDKIFIDSKCYTWEYIVNNYLMDLLGE